MDRTNFKGYRESLKSRCLNFFSILYVLDELSYIYSKNRLGKKNK